MTDRGGHYRRDIQGLRGIAVLVVVAFHAGVLRGGFRGVDIFFVISGFVITGLLQREWSATGRVDLRRFYVRRMRRLLPALALTVGIVCAAAILLLPPNGRQQEAAQTGLGAMLISANVVLPRLATNYFADAASENPLVHTWSLSVEEQFYLVFVGLLVAAFVMARSRQWLPITVVAVVSGASGVLAIGAANSQLLSRLGVLGDPFYSPITRAWEFGAGALMALAASSRARSRPRWIVEMGSGIGAASIATAVAMPSGAAASANAALILAVAGGALMLWCGFAAESLVSRAVAFKPLAWIGDLSYSWYLWHWPAIVFARLLFPAFAWATLAASGISLLVAVLSFRFVENPIRSRPLAGTRVALLVGGPVASAIVIAGALGLGARRGWNQEWALGAHAVIARGCDVGTYEPERCRWPVPASVGSVLILGDSQAWAIADGVIAAASALELDTIASTHNACPFVWAPQEHPMSDISPACLSRNESLVRAARDLRPRVVVIANQSARYALQGEEWRLALAATVRQFTSARIGVLIISVAPIADEFAKRTSIGLRGPAERYTTLESQPAARAIATAIDRTVAADNPGTVVFDPADVLCPEGRCVVARAGRVYYSDQNHLSRSGGLLLAPALQAALAKAIAHGQRP